MRSQHDQTECMHRDICQGTDAGGNCRMMRDVPSKQRTCWFSSEVRASSPKGDEDRQAAADYMRGVYAAWEKEGRCLNCGGLDDEHNADGSCNPGWEDGCDVLKAEGL